MTGFTVDSENDAGGHEDGNNFTNLVEFLAALKESHPSVFEGGTRKDFQSDNRIAGMHRAKAM